MIITCKSRWVRNPRCFSYHHQPNQTSLAHHPSFSDFPRALLAAPRPASSPRQAKHAASLQTASEEAARLGETLQQWQAECAEAGAGRGWCFLVEKSG